jgi:hypothetical protein
MATRTIANGGGNYNSTGTWVEGAVPTSADDVVATGTSGNLTVNVSSACRSIDLTGYTGTLAINSNLTIGDVVSVREGSKNAKVFTMLAEKIKDIKTAPWLEADLKNLTAKVISLPSETDQKFDIQKVLEFYSR